MEIPFLLFDCKHWVVDSLNRLGDELVLVMQAVQNVHTTLDSTMEGVD
jgi:hypothetical protein